MKYTKLGNSDLEISSICLGTMTFGEQNTQEEAFEQLDYALDRGVNFIDTAEIYSVPTKKATYGETERIIGNWIKARNNRDKFILATKVAGPGFPYIRNGSNLSKQQISEAIDASLKRLQTDYIDLYQLHWPNRQTNIFSKLDFPKPNNEESVEIQESLEALDELVKAGKVRHIGVSNETPWGMSKFLDYTKNNGLAEVISIQNPYSLLNRVYEIGLSEFSYRENIGLLAYSPLGFGVLSGKYLNNQQPAKSRLALFSPDFGRFSNPASVRATEKYCDVAKKFNLDPAQMALAFVNSRFFTASNIIGATTLEQLKSNIDSIDLELSEEVLKEIEQIHKENSNPAP